VQNFSLNYMRDYTLSGETCHVQTLKIAADAISQDQPPGLGAP